jgi:hypothetical protein
MEGTEKAPGVSLAMPSPQENFAQFVPEVKLKTQPKGSPFEPENFSAIHNFVLSARVAKRSSRRMKCCCSSFFLPRCVAGAKCQTVNSLITCASGDWVCLVAQAGEKTRGWLGMVVQAWRCSGVWILLDSAVRRNWGGQLGSQAEDASRKVEWSRDRCVEGHRLSLIVFDGIGIVAHQSRSFRK